MDRKDLSQFEQFVKDSKIEENEKVLSLIGNEKLSQTVADVKAVRERMEKQMSIVEIAKALDMKQEYVLLIAMNIQGRHLEDDDIATAHLIMMG